ncbi:hypothetical protein [Chryseobacterium koreense]|nr:hypothetical protein [Chryseobacterium koreense]MBB5334888.1 uncharacterized membrane protein (DUF106 family) [Chryseobacterium koreense]
MFIPVLAIIVFAFCLGLIVGAVLTLIIDSSTDHVIDMEDYYQSFE